MRHTLAVTATVARCSFLENDAFFFNGTQIPEGGPGGDRGATLVFDERTGLFFWATVVHTNGGDGQVYAAVKGDMPGIAMEVARKFAVGFVASLPAIRRAASSSSSSRLVLVALEDKNGKSVTGAPRAAPFVEAVREATSGAVVMPLLNLVKATPASGAIGRRGTAARALAGTVVVDRGAAKSLTSDDTVVVIGEDSHVDYRSALDALRALGVAALGVSVWRQKGYDYPLATEAQLLPEVRAWQPAASTNARHARDAARARRAPRETSPRSQKLHHCMPLNGTKTRRLSCMATRPQVRRPAPVDPPDGREGARDAPARLGWRLHVHERSLRFQLRRVVHAGGG